MCEDYLKQRFQLLQGLFKAGFFFDGLSEEAIDLVDVLDGKISAFVRSGLIFADADQELVFFVVGKHFSHFADQLQMFFIEDMRQDTADRASTSMAG